MFNKGTLEGWIAELGIVSRLRYLGYLADADLVAVMNAAAALVFPSLYEGFGLPALEAMACGTPVICSGTTALEEIGGPAIRIDLCSTDSIAGAMVQVAGEQFDRSTLIELGLRHVKQFSWPAGARQKLDAYARIADRSYRPGRASTIPKF
jgi:glycosyltransferase involved in cell wall biosynthesis